MFMQSNWLQYDTSFMFSWHLVSTMFGNAWAFVLVYVWLFPEHIDSALVGVQCMSECPDGWVVNNGSCYLFGHGGSLTFDESEHFCQQHHAALVHVDSVKENLFLKDYLTRLVGGRHFWLGLTDQMLEGDFRWSDDDTKPGYTDWSPGEPDTHGNEDCVVFDYGHGYKWADIPCSLRYQPLCEKRKVLEYPLLIG